MLIASPNNENCLKGYISNLVLREIVQGEMQQTATITSRLKQFSVACTACILLINGRKPLLFKCVINCIWPDEQPALRIFFPFGLFSTSGEDRIYESQAHGNTRHPRQNVWCTDTAPAFLLSSSEEIVRGKGKGFFLKKTLVIKMYSFIVIYYFIYSLHEYPAPSPRGF